MKKAPLKNNPVKKVALSHKKENPVSYLNFIGLGIIILLGFIIYSNSFGCSWHFDDFPNIVKNAKIHSISDWRAWWNFYPNRPISVFSFVLNYHFNHYDIWWYHLINLLIHIINACLVLWITYLAFETPALKNHALAKHRNYFAFFTALLFLTHPLATQSVTYIVQRMASMAAMFYLLSIALYIKARLGEMSRISRYILFAVCAISGILALLSKENAYTLPLALLLTELLLIRKQKIRLNFKDYRIYLIVAALAGMAVFVIFNFSFAILKPIAPQPGRLYTVTPENYLFTQFGVIVKYLQMLLFPYNQMLEHGFRISNNFFEIRTILCFLLLASIVALGGFLLKKQPLISFGIFWFFLTLLIESGFIPIADIIFEHRTYLPSFGFFLVVTSLIMLLWNKHRNAAIGIFVIIIGINSILTFNRNKAWKTEITLLTDNIEKEPDLARPFYNRGIEYSMLKQYSKANADYARAIELIPTYLDAYKYRALNYYNMGVFDKAIEDYDVVIRMNPRNKEAWFNRSISYAKLNQWPKAIEGYTRTIELNPGMATIYVNRGIAYGNINKMDNAIADFATAAKIDPNYEDAWFNIAYAKSIKGDWPGVIEAYTALIRINPLNKESFYGRGLAYSKTGQTDKAIADYDKALQIDPNYSSARANRDAIAANVKKSGAGHR
jgi:protein O-mannosyl-transferase